MPNRQTRRTAAKKVSPEDQTIMEITVGGVEYHLSFVDVSAWDEEILERASRPKDDRGNPIPGERGISLTNEMASGDFTLKAIAGMVFIRRHEGNPKVTYEEVARQVRLSDLETVKMLSPDEVEAKKGVEPSDPSL